MASQPLVFNSSHFIATPSGNWSFFDIGVGTPPQNFSVLVSTIDNSLILPFYEGGVQTQGLFNSHDSSSWDEYIPEWGADLVSVGSNNMSMEILGDNAAPPLFGVVMDVDWDSSSYGIPSQSFGYTAGAAYRNASASLVLGGYDETEIAAMGPSFNLSSDYMNVTLTNITATKTLDNSTNILPSPVFMLLDSSNEDLYMPTVICDRFISAFGLISNKSDPDSVSFYINGSTHQQLRSLNPTITFTLADPDSPSANVDIALSYKSLDYAFSNDSDTGVNIHFPLRDAGNASNGTLGRVFFQEIYAIVDYSRGNFTISQAAIINTSNHVPSIITISDGSTEAFIDTVGGIVLVSLSTVVGIALIPATIFWINAMLRRRHAKPVRERQKKLDQIWIQIHSVKPEGEEEEEKEEDDDRRDDENQEGDRLLEN